MKVSTRFGSFYGDGREGRDEWKGVEGKEWGGGDGEGGNVGVVVSVGW